MTQAQGIFLETDDMYITKAPSSEEHFGIQKTPIVQGYETEVTKAHTIEATTSLKHEGWDAPAGPEA